MQFLKFTASITNQIWLDENNDRDVLAERKLAICAESESWNDGTGEVFFVSDISLSNVKGAALVTDEKNAGKRVAAFLRKLNVPAGVPKLEEITFDAWKQHLTTAYRKDYIEDDDRMLETLALDPLTDWHRESSFREFMLDGTPAQKRLLQRVQELPATETLAPELARIFEKGRIARAIGHPVHYVVFADGEETQNAFAQTLGAALYQSGRIHNRRCCCADLRYCSAPEPDWLDALYSSSVGGMLMLRLASRDAGDRGEFAAAFAAIAAAVGERTQKFRHSVLTVFCLPRTCEAEKGMLFENLGSVGLIELREDLLAGERAQTFLKRLAKETGIRSDQRLLQQAEPEKTFLPSELRELFNEWFNEKLKTVVYPQYKEMAVGSRTQAKKTTKGSAWDELQEMIGLADAKGVIGKALDYYKLQRIYKDKGVKQDRLAMHMVFTGNPGTAKTTTARLFARIMKENGLLSKGHLVEVGRSDLVERFVGWTAKAVQEKCKAAMGGVLFVDEAYALADERGGSFGDEAINTIVQEMENRREDLVVIFAGYPEEMERFLDRNPGLRSRIAFHVPFADYSCAELCDIAKLIAGQKGVALTEAASLKLRTVFETARLQPDFGNGRYARNMIEQAKMNMASRILSMDADAVTKETLTRIEETDIDLPEPQKISYPKVIGFGA